MKNGDKVWEGEMLIVFIDKTQSNEMTEISGARDSPTWDENSSILDLEGLLSNPIRLLMGDHVNTFETFSDNFKFCLPK